MIERRSTAAIVAASRDAASAAVSVGGVAIPYESDSEPLPFIESFAPGAFRDQQITDGFAGVTGNFQHDGVFILASVDSATMQVVDGALGLRYTMRVPASLGYVQEMVASGVTAGASIGFCALADEWSVDAATGAPRRLVTRAHLVEVSIVGSPAYRAATAAIAAGPLPARSLRSGRVLSAKNYGTVEGVANALRDLIDAALVGKPADSDVLDGISRDDLESAHAQLRDLLDAAKTGAPGDSTIGDTDYGQPEHDSITVDEAERQMRRRGRRHMAELERSLMARHLDARHALAVAEAHSARRR